MATAAVLEAGGAIWRRGEPLATRATAGNGGSHTPSPKGEAGVPVGAGGWPRRAVYCGWRVAKVADGHCGGALFIAAGAWRRWPMATAALLEAGGRDLDSWGAAGRAGGGG
eukprot:scaffold4883_cov119-Isochrysis_galbana.AAC.1